MVPPARALPGPLPSCPQPYEVRTCGPILQAGEIETRKEKRREGSQCAEPEPAGFNWGDRLLLPPTC